MYTKRSLFSTAPPQPPRPSPLPSPPPPEVAKLADALAEQRVRREVALALRTGLRDAGAEFSFLRLRGLRSLLRFLRAISDSDPAVRIFRDLQSSAEFQVVTVLFEHALGMPKPDPVVSLDRVFGVEPMRVTSPATEAEVALALRVLEGCCLISGECSSMAHQHRAVKMLLELLSTRGVLVQGPCLDALISLLLGSPFCLTDFEACNGIEKVVKILKDNGRDEDMRLKCGEFLLLLIGNMHDRERSPVFDKIKGLLGEICASLIWSASKFGSTLEPEQRLIALNIQAHRVLECLELN